MSDLLLPSDAARILNVTPAAVRAMEARGELRALRTERGHRVFLRSEIEAAHAAR